MRFTFLFLTIDLPRVDECLVGNKIEDRKNGYEVVLLVQMRENDDMGVVCGNRDGTICSHLGNILFEFDMYLQWLRDHFCPGNNI